MKLRMSVLLLMAALGSACTSTDKPRSALDVKPVLSVRHSAHDARSHYQLGRYYHGQNRLAQAEEAYLRATALDAGHVDAINALGSLYAERGELGRAAETFEQAIAMAPDAAYLHNNLGYAYHLLGRNDDAYTAVRHALRLDARLERAWANIQRIAGQRYVGALAKAVVARQFDGLPSALHGSESAGPANAPNPEALTNTTGEASGEPAANSSNAGKGEAQEILPAGPEAISQGSTAESPMDFSALRIEVSNGNGVPHFARNFRSQLKANGIPVSRVTNLGSFRLRETIVEYQPGHEPAARALSTRLGRGLAVRIVPAIKARPRSDIRIALGQDAARLAGERNWAKAHIKDTAFESPTLSPTRS